MLAKTLNNLQSSNSSSFSVSSSPKLQNQDKAHNNSSSFRIDHILLNTKNSGNTNNNNNNNSSTPSLNETTDETKNQFSIDAQNSRTNMSYDYSPYLMLQKTLQNQHFKTNSNQFLFNSNFKFYKYEKKTSFFNCL